MLLSSSGEFVWLSDVLLLTKSDTGCRVQALLLKHGSPRAWNSIKHIFFPAQKLCYFSLKTSKKPKNLLKNHRNIKFIIPIWCKKIWMFEISFWYLKMLHFSNIELTFISYLKGMPTIIDSSLTLLTLMWNCLKRGLLTWNSPISPF